MSADNDDKQLALLDTQEVGTEWLTDQQHILRRPEMYVGSAVQQICSGVAFLLATGETGKSTLERADFSTDVSPAVLKSIDEIVTNATDAALRDKTVKRVHINICPLTGQVGVHNDGGGIPAKRWKDGEDIFNITVLFGRYRSGTNLSEASSRGLIQGGRNGMGVSLTNTFAKKFRVVTGCPETQTLFSQTWEENLSIEHAAVIKTYKAKTGFVYVECLPDWVSLGMPPPPPDGLPRGLLLALARRASDVAICSTLRPLKVSLTLDPSSEAPPPPIPRPPPVSGCTIPLRGGAEYLHAILGGGGKGVAKRPIAIDVVSRVDGLRLLEVACCVVTREEAAYLEAASAQHVGFVNAFRCSRGSHIKLHHSGIVDVVRQGVTARLKRKDPTSLKPHAVMQHLATCTITLVENKAFESQSKEELKTALKDLGFHWKPSPKFTSTLIDKTDLVSRVVAALETKEADTEKKTLRNHSAHIAKYNPPSGGKGGGIKRLLITEGDSAKAFVVAGLSAPSVGRHDFGIFPLRGKPLNTRKKTTHDIQQNRELAAITQILGLTPGTEYTPELVAKLPFAHLTLVCDQDHDGSHIAGLVVNWIHDRFPTLLKSKPDFIERFYTAIVRATLKGGSEECLFYTLRQYEDWILSLPEGGVKKYSVKYFKGLGTSTSSEARGYFTRMKKDGMHLLPLHYGGVADDEAMVSFFGPGVENIEARKRMLADYNITADFMDFTAPHASFNTLVQKDLCPFMHYDNTRAIPGPDGLKPSQRKVLYYFMDKKVVVETKVAQAGASVAEYTHYHHGEDSIIETIVKMAQEHVGSNNIAYLVPEGQFGSRAQGRKEHAAARYIFTHMNPILRCIFREEDDVILSRVVDEGRVVEPEYYIGVVPPVLLNGADGTGTGFKTLIPSFSPLGVMACCRKIAEVGLVGGIDAAMDVELPCIEPHFAGFDGKTWVEDGTVYTRGSYEIELNTNRLIITELPPGKWTEDVVAHIRDHHMIVKETQETKKRKNIDVSPSPDTLASASGNGKGKGGVTKAALVTDLFDGSSEHRVRIELEINPDHLEAMEETPELVWATFPGLCARIPMTTMNTFDSTGKLTRMQHPHESIRVHAKLRFCAYTRRRAHQIDAKQRELVLIRERLRFVMLVVEGQVVIGGRALSAISTELGERGFVPREGGFEHLLHMTMLNITAEKAEALRMNVARIEDALLALEATTEFGLWQKELGELEDAYALYITGKAERQGDVTSVTKGEVKKKRKRKNRL